MKHILAIAVLLVAGCKGRIHIESAAPAYESESEFQQESESEDVIRDVEEPNVIVFSWNGYEHVYDYEFKRHGVPSHVRVIELDGDATPHFTTASLMDKEGDVIYAKLLSDGQPQTLRVVSDCLITTVPCVLEHRRKLPMPKFDVAPMSEDEKPDFECEKCKKFAEDAGEESP